jgi:hypothetical protein
MHAHTDRTTKLFQANSQWVVILQHPNPKVKDELEKLAGHPSKLGLG